MPPHKPIVRWAVCFALIAALLLAPWPRVSGGYANLFRAAGQRMFGKFGSKGLVFFQPAEAADAFLDTRLIIGNRDQLKPGGRLPGATIDLSTRTSGYVPVAFLIALILATPLPWRRRLRALGWGLLWVHGFIAALLALMIVYQYSNNPSIGLFQLGWFWKKTVDALYQIFVGYIGALFVVPVVIWLGVMFRRGDLSIILGLPEEPRPAPAK